MMGFNYSFTLKFSEILFNTFPFLSFTYKINKDVKKTYKLTQGEGESKMYHVIN